MRGRLGYFGVIVVAILIANAAGHLIGTLIEGVVEVFILSFLIPLIVRSGNGGSGSAKPSGGLLSRLWRGAGPGVVSEARYTDQPPAKRRNF